MKKLLVIEDGSEYEEFARLFLSKEFLVLAAHSAAAAFELLEREGSDAVLLDLRFDRAPREGLVGDVAALAKRLFAGDEARALRYVQEEQGTLILAELRARGHALPVVFVHDFPRRRLDNLRRMYGDVRAVPSFDAASILAMLAGGAAS